MIREIPENKGINRGISENKGRNKGGNENANHDRACNLIAAQCVRELPDWKRWLASA